MKKRTEIEWRIPGGSLVYSGTPKTRMEWIRLTWRGYLAYWQLTVRASFVLMGDYRERAYSIWSAEIQRLKGEGHGSN